jgi:hypothetical protein
MARRDDSKQRRCVTNRVFDPHGLLAGLRQHAASTTRAPQTLTISSPTLDLLIGLRVRIIQPDSQSD